MTHGYQQNVCWLILTWKKIKTAFLIIQNWKPSADVIYNYQYYDIIGIIKYLCGIIVLNSVTYILKKTRKKYCKKTIEIAQLFYYQYVYMCFMKKF